MPKRRKSTRKATRKRSVKSSSLGFASKSYKAEIAAAKQLGRLEGKMSKRAPSRRRTVRKYARKTQRGARRLKRGLSALGPTTKTILWGVAGAAVTGYLQGAKGQDGQSFAQKIPQIPLLGAEGTLAVVLYAAGWAFRMPILKKLSSGPAVIAGYKLFRGVARGMATGSLGLGGEIAVSMTTAGLPDESDAEI